MPQLIHSLKEFPPTARGGAISVGNFDGVHRGHECLIKRLVSQARHLGGKAVVFTFDPPPMAVLKPSLPLLAPLTDMRRRTQLLGDLGVDVVIAYPTDIQLLELTAEQFFHQILINALGAKAIVEGPNFRFGRERLGETHLLNELCRADGIALEIVAAKSDRDGMVSSTRIRELIVNGQLAEANALLTAPYAITGLVSHGEGRGKKLGSPTANLTDIAVLVPKQGVYAGCVTLENCVHPAAIHIGPNPTFGEENTKVEVHILDWHGELYEDSMCCSVLQELRSVRRFESVAELQAQIALDIEACRTIFEARR